MNDIEIISTRDFDSLTIRDGRPRESNLDIAGTDHFMDFKIGKNIFDVRRIETQAHRKEIDFGKTGPIVGKDFRVFVLKLKIWKRGGVKHRGG